MNLDRIADNRTPMALACLPMDDRRGAEVMVAIAKMTWDVSPAGRAAIAHPQAPVRSSDEWHSRGRHGSVRRPGDLVPERPGTDVIVVASAWPQRAGATEQDVTLRMGSSRSWIDKTLRVHGPRVWQAGLLGPTPGPAAPLGPTPLVWDLAYGGHDDSEPAAPLLELENPAGAGVAASRASLVGKAAPRIEDPRAPIGARGGAPAGFAPIPTTWLPRSRHSGTADERWARERSPYPPADRHPRFYSSAPADQWLETPLVGDEPVELLGATPEGAWRFRLPPYAPRFRSVVRGVTTDHPTHLDLFLIDAEERKVELTWRAAIPMPRRVDFLESIQVTGEPRLSDSLFDELRARLGLGLEVSPP